jgi:hypothetical protein
MQCCIVRKNGSDNTATPKALLTLAPWTGREQICYLATKGTKASAVTSVQPLQAFLPMTFCRCKNEFKD